MFADDPFFNGGRDPRRGNNQVAHRSSQQDPFGMMQGMMSGFGNFGMMPFGGGDPFSGFDMMDMNRGGGGGQFSCQSMVMSSRMGPDGQMHVEKFASSSAGDASRGLHERQQAYSNSSSGVDKMSMERQMGHQGRKVVKERKRGSQDETQTELYRGMEEHESGAFDERWNREAAPHMPRHGGMPRMQLGNGRGNPYGYDDREQRALPDPRDANPRGRQRRY